MQPEGCLVSILMVPKVLLMEFLDFSSVFNIFTCIAFVSLQGMALTYCWMLVLQRVHIQTLYVLREHHL